MKNSLGIGLILVFGFCCPVSADLLSTEELTSSITQNAVINGGLGNGNGPVASFVSGESAGINLLSLTEFNGLEGRHTLTFDGTGYTGTGSSSNHTVHIPTEIAGHQLDIKGTGGPFQGRFEGSAFVSSGDWGIISTRSALEFSFSGEAGVAAPVSSFGVSLNRDNAGQTITVSRLNEDGIEFDTVFEIENSTRSFFGVQSQRSDITSITFTQSSGNSQLGFDDVSFNTQVPTAVPEPTSAALLGLVMLTGVLFRRRS